MKREDFYESLVGKNKEEVVALLEMPRSDYESNEWVYITGKNFFGLNRRLYLFFSDGIVCDFFATCWS